MTNDIGLYAPPRQIDNLSTCYFYHTTDLPDYGLQTGEWDLRGDFDKYVGGIAFADKRVLDIGAGAGFLSFSAEKAGAREVVSFDMDTSRRQHWLPFHNKKPFSAPDEFHAQHDQWVEKWKNAYWLTHRLNNSKAKAIYGDVYNIPTEAGPFDIVLVCSILEHLADPIRALASISRVAASEMVITTPAVISEEKIAYFQGDSAMPRNDCTWWTYSIGTYRHVLRMLGFEIISITNNKFLYVTGNVRAERTTIIAKRTSG